MCRPWTDWRLCLFTLILGWGSLCHADAGHPNLDFSGDGRIDLNDAGFIYHFFYSGPMLPGEGSSTLGDMDGDHDVDVKDLLVVFRHFVLPDSEVSICGPILEGAVDLLYDPASGSVILNTDRSECRIVGFVLAGSTKTFRPDQFEPPFPLDTDLTPADKTSHQIGQVDMTLFGVLPGTDMNLGRVMAPGLSEQELLESLDVAEFAYYAHATRNSDYPKNMQLHRLPLPSLGDTDRDADVDSADLNTVLGHWTGAMEPGQGPIDLTFLDGDFDFDRDVDSLNVHQVIVNWTGAQSAPAPHPVIVVPEPSGPTALSLVSLVLCAPVRRRTRAGVLHGRQGLGS